MANERQTGRYITTSRIGNEVVRAFVPFPLPPDPPLKIGSYEETLLEQAGIALGRLDGLGSVLPDISILIYFYVRREAVLSSQIEGTQSSLSDLLLFESEEEPGVPLGDVQEVSDYVAALYFGMRLLDEGFPVSLRFFREVHRVLLAHGRGSEKEPGEFRRSQNWIGGTRPGNALFVPPPPHMLMECLGALEKFLHNEPVITTSLKKIALFHVQFESIHPFLDGNGRLGRILIPLLLYNEGILKSPLLYLSLYFKVNRDEYYKRLQRVRTHGEWEAWLRFFLEGIIDTAKQAVSLATSIIRLFEDDQVRIRNELGRSAATALRVQRQMQRKPVVNIKEMAGLCQISIPTAGSALERLENLGIAQELTGRKRDRIFSYRRYISLLSEGTEPIQRNR